MPTKLSLSLARSLATLSRANVDAMDKSTLVLTQVIFRHGQRAPDKKLKYSGDPYENNTFYPFGHGELTLIGRKQCYHLGQKLRQRYAEFLGPEYYNGLVDAKSSELSRARTTLQLVLASLFPPTETTQIHDQLNWHPIPFTYKPINEDKLIGCAVLNMYKHEDHPEFRKSENSQDVIRCIEKQLKWDVKVHAQCMLIFDTVKTQIDLGLPVPKWCVEIFPDKLQKEFECFSQHNFGRKKWLTDGCGGLIQEINKVMSRKISQITHSEEEQVPKMYLYSGHDINLAGLLTIFKQFDVTKWPKYTANLAFELHQIDGEFYVKMLYQDGQDGRDARNMNEEQKLEAFTLPHSKNTFCKLSDFTKYVQDYFPESSTYT